MYFCYCFNKEGNYDKPKPFNSPEDALAYVTQNQNLFSRILITDLLDCTVFEMVDGKVVFPAREDMQSAQSVGIINIDDVLLTFDEKLDKFLEILNETILPNINYDALQNSYWTPDKVYAKNTLRQMHDTFVTTFGTDFLTEDDGEFVLLPAVIKGKNTGELCVALVNIDLSSSGEHWGTDFLTKYGVLRQGSEDLTKEQRTFINQHYIRYQYFYTIGLENDIHVDLSSAPDDVKEMLNFCHANPEQKNNLEFAGP